MRAEIRIKTMSKQQLGLATLLCVALALCSGTIYAQAPPLPPGVAGAISAANTAAKSAHQAASGANQTAEQHPTAIEAVQNEMEAAAKAMGDAATAAVKVQQALEPEIQRLQDVATRMQETYDRLKKLADKDKKNKSKQDAADNAKIKLEKVKESVTDAANIKVYWEGIKAYYANAQKIWAQALANMQNARKAQPSREVIPTPDLIAGALIVGAAITVENVSKPPIPAPASP